MAGYNQKLANASFFGALCVVLIHVGVKVPEGSFSWWVYQLTANGFCRWAVPFFFAAAGYLLAAHVDEPGWWKCAVYRRARTLFVPYVLWNGLYSLFGLTLTVIANVKAGRSLMTNVLTGWDALRYLGLHPILGGYCIPLWFLMTLSLFVLASPFLVWLIRRSGWFVPVVLFGLTFVGLPSMPHNFNPGWMMYFAAGIAARFRPVRLGKVYGLGVVVGMAWIAAHKQAMLSAGVVDHWDATPLPAVILVVTGVWSLVPENLRLPRYLSSATFPIYLMHSFVLTGLFCCFPPIVSFLGQMVTWLAVVVICVAVTAVLRAKFERMSRGLYGGR